MMSDESFVQKDDLDEFLVYNDSKVNLTQMEQDMRNLLSCFRMSKEEFSDANLRSQFETYFQRYDRLLYSAITSFLIELSRKDEDSIDNIVQRISSFYESENAQSMDVKLRNKIIKLYDHVNLVINQNSNFYTSQSNIRKISEEEAQKAKKDVSKVVNDLQSQLISIVSIFVAIAFVLFGGMSLMNNLFNYENIDRIPLLEMLCAGSLIGIIMIMSIYAFIVFVLRITGKYDYSKEQQDNIKNLTDLVNRIYEDSNKSLLGKIFALITYGKSKVKAPYRNVVAVVLFVLLSIMVVCGSIVYFS